MARRRTATLPGDDVFQKLSGGSAYSTENFNHGPFALTEGEKLAAVSVSASAACWYLRYLLSVSRDGEPVRLELQDELILSLRYKATERIHMITDRAVVLMDESGA